jgi:hypothetical protein
VVLNLGEKLPHSYVSAARRRRSSLVYGSFVSSSSETPIHLPVVTADALLA